MFLKDMNLLAKIIFALIVSNAVILHETVKEGAFACNVENVSTRFCVPMHLLSLIRNINNMVIKLIVVVSPKLPNNIVPKHNTGINWDHLQDIKLADSYPFDNQEADVLIVADYVIMGKSYFQDYEQALRKPQSFETVYFDGSQ